MFVEILLPCLDPFQLPISLCTAAEVCEHDRVPPSDQITSKTLRGVHDRLQVRTFQGKRAILHILSEGAALCDFVVLEVVVQDVTEERRWLDPRE